ncbi:hypothetical protein L596_029143 [Steinernema carpocapsae]|uniref:Major facilitator superfamily (MFS) profile domain-containing protein n=1 Tax=Steinernema carpocapsae TaxID=34508 RepID=A0A4U5LTS9_STECR|nr:hypothetical protein L596_029143 [Steinernema carpocapsae]
MIRYVVLAITLVTMSVLLANTVLFNFTVICMTRESDFPYANGTKHHLRLFKCVLETHEARFYSPSEEGWIIAAPSVGLITGTVPSIYLTQKRGLRQAFTFFGLCSGLATLAYPLMAENFAVSFVIRFVQGFAVASAFVAIGIVPMEYGGEHEKGLFVAVLTATYQLGPFSTIPASALFCSSSVGWQGVYYVFGAVSMTSFVLFFVFYRNSAHKNRTLSRTRVLPLTSDELKLAKTKKTIPYRRIFATKSVWGVINAGISDSVGYLVFFLYGPIYVNKVLKFDVESTGLLAAVPYVVAGGTKMFAGFFMHKSSCMSKAAGVKWSTFISEKITAVLFVILAFIGAEMPLVAEVLLTLNVAATGFHFIGVMAAAQTVAQQHTQVLSSSIAAIESFFGLLLPPIVSYMAPDHTADQWAVIFYYVAGLLVITNFLFFFLTKVEAADWTKKDKQRKGALDKISDTASV